jgi:hypothetical protein
MIRLLVSAVVCGLLDLAPQHPHRVAQGQQLDRARSFDAHTW